MFDQLLKILNIRSELKSFPVNRSIIISGLNKILPIVSMTEKMKKRDNHNVFLIML